MKQSLVTLSLVALMSFGLHTYVNKTLFIPEANLAQVPAILQGDLNNDGIVNSIDWSIMNARWFTNDAIADINKDGIVNSIDFSILNKNWLRSTPPITPPVVPPPPANSVVELPRVYLYPMLASARSAPTVRTVNVSTGPEFQTALNNAQFEDTIILQAGTTYVGNFVLRKIANGTG